MQFQSQEIINYDDKSIILLCKDKEGIQQIVKLKKKQFPLQYQYRFDKVLKMAQYHQNDIFNKYELVLDDQTLNEMDCEIIKPANEILINKYTKSPLLVVEETPQMYNQFLTPFIKTKSQQSNLQWLYNILEGHAEKENVLFQHEQFMLIRNYTFTDESNVEQLHLLGLPLRRDLRSLRDIDQRHVPLLEEIWRVGRAYIQERYKIKANEIISFLHYQPSFYHLHIHFRHINSNENDSLRDNHLVSVIQNVRMKSDYYQTATLQYRLNLNQYKMIFQEEQQQA